MTYVKRSISTALLDLAKQYPILAVTGPRQSGKTTLLKNLFKDYQYVSLENIDQRTFAEDDPVGFLKQYGQKVILDEVQRAPTLFSYLQTKVDNSEEMGRFILSGSQNFHLLESIMQSLSGRVALFKLMPFDNSELAAAGLLSNDWKELIIKGCYPAIYSRGIRPDRFYSNYLQTYIDRDISDLASIHNHRQFRNFVLLCAGRIGQVLNISALAKKCGISQPTAKSWLAVLEKSYIIFLLPPYFKNFNKRVIKSPKLYFYDVGMAAFLRGFRTKDQLTDPTALGSFFENLIVTDILKTNFHSYALRDYWYWRDSAGHEVDLLTPLGEALEVFEIKSTQTVLPKLFSGLNYFSKIAEGLTVKKVLAYGGDTSYKRNDVDIRSWKNAFGEVGADNT